MTKREFFQVVGAGLAASATLGSRPAWAQGIRILGGPKETTEDPGLPGQRSVELTKLVAAVRVGARRSHGGLHVFWLLGPSARTPFAIATLEEAQSRGDLAITERERASVPSLVVDNRGKAHVLLLAGEILLGGKQNRIVTEDILLPPLSGPIDLHVYCVEQGRWSPGASRDEFSGHGTVAAPALRSKVANARSQDVQAPRGAEGRGQGEVWAEVERYAQQFAAPSPTQSLQAVYDKAEVKAHQAEAEQALDTRAASGALGAAVFAGGSLAAVDLFEDSGLFTRQWPKLLRAYALDGYRRQTPGNVDEIGLRKHVEALLRRAGGVDGSLRRNAGVGRLFEFRLDGRRGSALLAEGQVAHAAVL